MIDMKTSKEELDERYNKTLLQIEDMKAKFEIAAEQLRLRADYKNSILDEKLMQN
jgi:hypothetical protein